MRPSFRLLAATVVLAAACGGGTADQSPAAAASAAPAAAAVPLTGNINEVTKQSNDKGNYFEPSTFTAKPGDVVRFKLVQGVHNVNFLPDSNPGHATLPASTAYAQLPGQALDVPLTFGTGTFFFQCDPHAMLGMVGRVTVAP
jgi:plastocyanin